MNDNKRRYLNEEELGRFFSAIKQEKRRFLRTRDMAIFWLSYSCGLRIGEAAGLRISDLYLDQPETKFCLVRRLKRRQTKKGIPLAQKREPILSKCKLHLEDQKVLGEWLKVRGKLRAATLNPFVFINPTAGEDDHLLPTSIYYRFKKYAERAGLGREGTKLSPHSLRHSCAVMMAIAGLNSFDLQDHLGHASSSSTEPYVRLFGPEHEAREERIGKALRFKR